MSTNLTMIGRLTKDVELKQSRNGNSYGLLRLAVQRDYKLKNGEYPTDFFTVLLWGKKAEIISEHTGKGDLVAVYGRLETNQETQDTLDKNYVNIQGDTVKFLSRVNRNTAEGEEIEHTDEQVIDVETSEPFTPSNEIPNDYIPEERSDDEYY